MKKSPLTTLVNGPLRCGKQDLNLHGLAATRPTTYEHPVASDDRKELTTTHFPVCTSKPENENAGDRLPAFDTWAKQLRNARNPLGEQKYTRRGGRPTGRSIVASKEI
jgi:hypothetical protein